MSPLARFAAALVAGIAWLGLAVQVVASVALTGSLAAALWTMLLYFTVIANLVVALAFTAAALDGRARPRLLAFATTAILLVGIVYAALLRGLLELSGGARLADTLLHIVVPLLVPLFWLAFVPKGRLRRHDPLLWLLLPLAYYAYGLTRGALEGRYPYPFMDVARIGWGMAAAYAAAMGVGVLVAGVGLVWVDGRLGSIH